jgi:branched-subunit amino acid aminotransferase/4-amino-4-deoxychorismate lyase
MAKFEGLQWAAQQLRYLLIEKSAELAPADDRIPAISRSTNYATFLCFEGIRFFCAKTPAGGLEIRFLNWHKNLERFRRGIAFNLGREQGAIVPSVAELEALFIERYFKSAAMRPFLEEMAGLGAQGYLRPFTVDEEQSIGVTFPNQPAIRTLACRYDQYLGEPFTGVVIPHLVRAHGANKTGWLKLGINYLISIKAIDEAKRIVPEAAAALFLDDRPDRPVEEREITEWDSSCCLFALKDGTVVKIPESPLILPSVTIQGMVAILRGMGVEVEERPVRYGELLRLAKAGDLVAAASVGTAGILNRCQRLVLVDGALNPVAAHVPDEKHPLYAKLREARTLYWNIYQEKAAPPEGMTLHRYAL